MLIRRLHRITSPTRLGIYERQFYGRKNWALLQLSTSPRNRGTAPNTFYTIR